MTDLSIILRIYQGSDGEATQMLYRDLEAMGPWGEIGMNLFRACKCSERAKSYRGGGYKAQAYARKDWSIRNLAAALHTPVAVAAGLRWGWAIDHDLRERGDPHHHLLYVELPAGQVSFHTSARGEGPDFDGQWDGRRGVGAERICRFVADLFKQQVPV